MARTYLWVGVISLLCCQTHAVHGGQAVSTSPASSFSFGGRGVLMSGDTTIIERSFGKGVYLPWSRQRLAMGDHVSLESHDVDRQDQLLAEARRAVAAGEPATLEAFIAASVRRREEREALKVDEKEPSVTRNILGAIENSKGYIGSMLNGILPSWTHPTAGQIRRADECFHQVESVLVRPGCDSYATACSPYEPVTSDAPNAASNGPNASSASGACTDGIDHGGGGWYYCTHHKRLVQLGPTFFRPLSATAGCDIVERLSPTSKAEHSSYSEDLLFDSLLEADRALYEAQHMQLALFVDPDVHLPAAVEARLAQHIAELIDERAVFETILEGIIERDEKEQSERDKQTRMREQAELETHITTQIQHLLSGGSGQRSCEEDEQPSSSVCLEHECYLFVPADESKTQCDELQCTEPTRIFRTPPMNHCASPETLRGNDAHATSPANCHQNLSGHILPVSVEAPFVYPSENSTEPPPPYYRGPLYNTGTAPQLPGQRWGFKDELDILWGASVGVREVGELTDVEAMRSELHVVKPEARMALQKAAQREELLRSRLSLALADKRNATAQSANLAAELAHVNEKLQDEKTANIEMAMARANALEAETKEREMKEIASDAARTCSLVLDDTKFTVFELEDALRAVLNGAGGLTGWRLERAKVIGRSKECAARLKECSARFEQEVEVNAANVERLLELEGELRFYFEEGTAFLEKADECRLRLEEAEQRSKKDRLDCDQQLVSLDGSNVACECPGMEAFSPDTVNSAPLTATAQAGMCFEEVESLLGRPPSCFFDHHDEWPGIGSHGCRQ